MNALERRIRRLEQLAAAPRKGHYNKPAFDWDGYRGEMAAQDAELTSDEQHAIVATYQAALKGHQPWPTAR